MSIRAVIFDLGGVLVRTEDHTPRERLAKNFGLTYDELYKLIFDNESARLATLGKITAAEHWEAVRENLALSEGELPNLPDQFWGGDSLDKDLVDLIRSLQPTYKTGLLSNAWDEVRDFLVNRWRIEDAFHEVVISAEVGLAKPDLRIYRLTLARLEVAPSEAVFVDDFVENVRAAQEVGMHAIRFRSPDQARKDLLNMLDGGSRSDVR